MPDQILPCCAIYGSNASGKSTLLRGLQFMDAAVRESHRLWDATGGVPVDQFKGGGRPSESSFVLDFVFESTRYQYAFAATRERIVQEWLFSFPNSRRQVLYKREADRPMFFGRALLGENKAIERLMRKNSLYISTAAQNDHELLTKIYAWFSRSIWYVFSKSLDPDSYTTRAAKSEHVRSAMTALLSSADFGISGLEYHVQPADPEVQEKYRQLLDAVKTIFGYSGELPMPPFGREASTLKLVHKLGGDNVLFDLADESDGTKAFLALLGPVVRCLSEGSALIVDELDASLHPHMSARILRLFNNPESNPSGAQIIFNTHETHLLSRDLLRPDQLWFTEKDGDGVSHIYPLTDFTPRKDENLQSGYLRGRYGAIPVLDPAVPLFG